MPFVTEATVTKSDLKKSVLEAIDARREDIVNLGQDIFEHPELGFKETRTAGVVASFFRGLGLQTTEGLALTGVKASFDHKAGPGPVVALMGELDAVVCPAHPKADKRTGAAHCCGHNIQLAGLVGAAVGLVESRVVEKLGGRIVFLAIPAEEYVELEYRLDLREQRKIEFFGGKQEWIRLGLFDDVDISMIIHALDLEVIRHVVLSGTTSGFIGKTVIYRGREAHAGGAPEKGINALDAAMLGLMAIHAQRATFRDADNVRVHPILTHGGDLVNVVPSRAAIETYVRANNIEAMTDAVTKVDRALKAGADAVGAAVKITSIPGYLPCITPPDLNEIFAANAEGLVGEENVLPASHLAVSTDMGDVMHLMPGHHGWVGGVSGRLHSRDFDIVNPEFAYLTSAKLLALTAVDLLAGEADTAKKVINNFKPRMTKDSYLEFLRSMAGEEIHGKVLG